MKISSIIYQRIFWKFLIFQPPCSDKNRKVDIVRAEPMINASEIQSNGEAPSNGLVVNNRISLISQDSSTASNSSSIYDDEILDQNCQNQSKTFLAAREIYTTERTFKCVLDLLYKDFRNFVISKNAEKNSGKSISISLLGATFLSKFL